MLASSEPRHQPTPHVQEPPKLPLQVDLRLRPLPGLCLSLHFLRTNTKPMSGQTGPLHRCSHRSTQAQRPQGSTHSPGADAEDRAGAQAGLIQDWAGSDPGPARPTFPHTLS